MMGGGIQYSIGAIQLGGGLGQECGVKGQSECLVNVGEVGK